MPAFLRSVWGYVILQIVLRRLSKIQRLRVRSAVVTNVEMIFANRLPVKMQPAVPMIALPRAGWALYSDFLMVAVPRTLAVKLKMAVALVPSVSGLIPTAVMFAATELSGRVSNANLRFPDVPKVRPA
jgi:hypothetical protein